MFKMIGAALLLSLFAMAPAHAADVSVFKVGQRWTVKDSDMKVVIGRIEPFGKDKTAIHVSVFGVPCPPKMGCETANVAHAPFDLDAFAQSVDQMIDEDEEPDPGFDSGYAQWQQDKGGLFTIPVSLLPTLLFKAIESGTETPATKPL
jgi:hypothetical protein